MRITKIFIPLQKICIHYVKNKIGIMTEYEARPYLDEMLQAYERRVHVPSVETIKREREERFKRWEESRKK